MHRLWPTMNYYFIIITRRGKKKEKRRRWRLLERRGERRERARPATALLNCNVLGAHTVVCGGHSQIFGLRGERESAISRRTLSLSGARQEKGSFFADNTANKAKKIKGNPANCAPRAG